MTLDHIICPSTTLRNNASVLCDANRKIIRVVARRRVSANCFIIK